MRQRSPDKNKNKAAVTAAVISLVLSVAFILVAPRYFGKRLSIDHYRAFIEPEPAPSVGVIRIWHIASFKPYSGSLGAWLQQKAREYAESRINVYFEVSILSVGQAEEELNRGNFPDAVSFMRGTMDKGAFRDFEYNGSVVRAVPYCASGHVLVFDPSSGKSASELLSSAGTQDEFKKGRKPSCVCDIRGAGDLRRAELLGKCAFFEVAPLERETDLIQYIGPYCTVSDEKFSFVKDFILFLTSRDNLASLCEMGLLPVCEKLDADFPEEWINELYSGFSPEDVPVAFQ